MATDVEELEAQIRSALRYRAAQLPEPSSGLTEVEHRAGRRAPRTRYALVAAAVVLAMVVGIAIVVSASGTDDRSPVFDVSTSVPVLQIPSGVSVQQFGDRLVFVVRDGSRYSVFDTKVHHLQGENALWWCPDEKLFVAPTHAETFARSGRATGGPAQAGLDRFAATARRGRLFVDLQRRIPGTAGNSHTAEVATAGTATPWDSGPGTFCTGAFKANNALPRDVLHVDVLASATYDQQVYEVPQGLVEIRLRGAAGILFTFDDPRYRYCLLATDRGAPHSCRVVLGPGDYLVYDSVPGHRTAGYEATIRVNP